MALADATPVIDLTVLAEKLNQALQGVHGLGRIMQDEIASTGDRNTFLPGDGDDAVSLRAQTLRNMDARHAISIATIESRRKT